VTLSNGLRAVAEHWDRFPKLISLRVASTDAERAFQIADMPGAAEKVIVTFGDQQQTSPNPIRVSAGAVDAPTSRPPGLP
jgi:hypothetical protein